MENQRNTFDWTAWYASIPSIPGDWGRPAPSPSRTGRKLRFKRVLVWLPEPEAALA